MIGGLESEVSSDLYEIKGLKGFEGLIGINKVGLNESRVFEDIEREIRSDIEILILRYTLISEQIP